MGTQLNICFFKSFFKGNPITEIEKDAFANLPRLQVMYVFFTLFFINILTLILTRCKVTYTHIIVSNTLATLRANKDMKHTD